MKLIKLQPLFIKTKPESRHVFVKGYRGRYIFREPADYIVYLALVKQFVRLQQALDGAGPGGQAVQVHGYSLQPQTIQLLATDVCPEAGRELTKLMQSIHVAYTRYYSKKYSLKTILFSDVYKSTLIANNRDEMALLEAFHAVRGNKWYQDSRIFYAPGREAGWITHIRGVYAPK